MMCAIATVVAARAVAIVLAHAIAGNLRAYCEG